MGQSDRFIVIQRLLSSGRVVSRQRLLRELEVSPATLNRDIAKLRHQHGWPIDWADDIQGWRLDPTAPPGEAMPGLIFSPEEALALLTMQHLLEQMDMSGMLARHLGPIARKLDKLAQQVSTSTRKNGADDMRRYLRIADVATRKVSLPCFQTISSALLARQRLRITHSARTKQPGGEPTAREVSPQRLIHYRGNWYLDAWCHQKEALRSFAVDAITAAHALDQAAIDLPEEDLDNALGAGYGIFAGTDIQWAKLRFSAERSRWVCHERWHPAQRGALDAQQRWVLELPYADDRELVMDILRHVPEVEVLAPESLRAALLEKLELGIRTVSASSRLEPAIADDPSLCTEKKS